MDCILSVPAETAPTRLNVGRLEPLITNGMFCKKETAMKLTEKKCLPCEGGIPTLSPAEISRLKAEISPGWEVVDNHHLIRTFYFVNFRHTFDFVRRLAELAESEGHHPVIHIYFDKAVIEIWTHAIDGLSENDFILASKTDLLLNG